MVIYGIKAHDPMFPGLPDLYFYGWKPSISKPGGKDSAQFGADEKQAFTVEGNSGKWTRVVATIIANSFGHWRPTKAVRFIPKKNGK